MAERIKFPLPRPIPAGPVLALPRRRPASRAAGQVFDAAAAARESIDAIVSAARAPFGGGALAAEAPRLADVQRTLRQLEAVLAERERTIADSEARLAERERDLAEGETLLLARKKLAAVAREPATAGASPEEKAAFQQLRDELARQEAGLAESRQTLREREQFLDESETKLFEKVEAQQAKENELEQREEDLRARERRLREREAAMDPDAAARLKAEDEAARKRDEFNE